MAGKSPRKRPSGTGNRGKAKSGGRRPSRRNASPLIRSLGLVALGAVMAFGVTAYVGGSPALDGMPPRLTAMVERLMPEAEKPARARHDAKATAQRRKPERTHKPAQAVDRSPDRSIRTAAVPAPRPPRPLDGVKKNPDSPTAVAVRSPLDATPRPRQGVPEGGQDGGPEPRAALPGGPQTVRLTGLTFPICGEGPGKDCVIDADTFVLNGEAYRVADIEVPRAADPKCMREAALAAKATRRLRDLLNAGPIELRGIGPDEDIYGRKLRTVHRDGRSLGAALVADGLARPAGAGKGWCA